MMLVDLSHQLDEMTPVYPGDEWVTLNKQASIDQEGYETYYFATNLHAGTHLDVPRHIIEDHRFVSDFMIENFIGPAVILDVRGQTRIDYSKAYESLINKEDIVILYTGHDSHYQETSYYDSHPVITKELTRFLIKKQIKLLGMDIPSPDTEPYLRHQELLGAGICLLENLTNIEQLIGWPYIELYAVPLKIVAEASPVRAFAKVW